MTEDGDRAFTVPAEPAALDAVQDVLAGLWRQHPRVVESDRVRFETGLVEVLGNVVEHAFPTVPGSRPSGARELTITLSVSPSAVRAVLEDNGHPVEVDLGDVLMPGPDAESGRGLAIALATLDGLEHEWRDGRNRWTLWVRPGQSQ